MRKNMRAGARRYYKRQNRLRTADDWRAYRRAWMKSHRTTPTGNLIARLSHALWATLRKRSKTLSRRPPRGAFRLLPYTRADFIAHMQSRLEACNWTCPMCTTSLRKRFDIDHIIPIATAKTVEDVIRLFALSNLQALCPHCNRKVKRARLMKAA